MIVISLDMDETLVLSEHVRHSDDQLQLEFPDAHETLYTTPAPDLDAFLSALSQQNPLVVQIVICSSASQRYLDRVAEVLCLKEKGISHILSCRNPALAHFLPFKAAYVVHVDDAPRYESGAYSEFLSYHGKRKGAFWFEDPHTDRLIWLEKRPGTSLMQLLPAIQDAILGVCTRGSSS